MGSEHCINREKSSIFFSKGCSESVRQEIKHALHVRNEKLSKKYLGLPSHVGREKEESFKYLKDTIWKQVQGWMEKELSVGGKEVLLKSMAQAIPTYSMGCFNLPHGFCHHINGFFISFGGDQRKKARAKLLGLHGRS